MIGGMVLFAFLIRRYYATDNGKLVIDRLLLKTPVLGDLLRKSAVSRFTRTLGTLLSSGVSILDGLEITARTAGNRVIHDAVMESRGSIAGGDLTLHLQKLGPNLGRLFFVGRLVDLAADFCCLEHLRSPHWSRALSLRDHGTAFRDPLEWGSLTDGGRAVGRSTNEEAPCSSGGPRWENLPAGR